MRRATLVCALAALSVAAAGAQTGTPQSGSQRDDDRLDTVYMPGGRDRVDTLRRDSLSGIARLRRDMRLDSMELVHMLDSLESTVQARMRRNLAMTPSDWMPTRGERAAHELAIRQSMDMDFVFPNSYVPLFSVATGAVFRALGLAEDLTPRITYTLTRTEHVSVRIYNIRAELVRTIVNLSQRPGEYDFEWDLRDDSGARVPYGNYVAEVIVGNRLALRKRIEAP